MSEIKITKDSLENAILKDGLFVSGYVEGDSIDASGYGAHAEGYAESGSVIANGNGAHAEGYANSTGTLNASGNGAHAEGIGTKALANGAHAEGHLTTASANYSHAGGYVTIANQEAMTAIGQFNKTYETNDISTLFVVGNGTANRVSNRSNAFEVINNTSTSVRATVNGIKNVELGLPIGSIIMWPRETEPDGWLLCNGQSIETGAQYAKLRDVLGTTSVPNFNGLFPVGVGEGTDKNGETYEFTLGSYTPQSGCGEYSHKLTGDESGLPMHQHKINAGSGSTGSYRRPGAEDLATYSNINPGEYGVTDEIYVGPYNATINPLATTSVDAQQAHNNIPPYIAINFIIKYK